VLAEKNALLQYWITARRSPTSASSPTRTCVPDARPVKLDDVNLPAYMANRRPERLRLDADVTRCASS